MSETKPSSYDWIQGAQYISLVTFKKSGERVATPVWFASAGGKLYLYSAANAGKIKRIRNNASVEVAPCSIRGDVNGPTVAGTAEVLGASMGPFVHDLLNRKYTWKKRVFEGAASIPALLRLRKPTTDGFISIELS